MVAYANGNARSCCCGALSIRTGTHIIAGLYLLFALAMSCLLVGTLVTVVIEPRTFTTIAADESTTQFGEVGHESDETTHPFQTGDDETEEDLPFVIAALSVASLVVLLQLAFSVLLLVGAMRNHAGKCKPWLYFNLFLFGLSATFAAVSTLLATFLAGVMPGLSTAFSVAIPIWVMWYYISVVRRFIMDVTFGGNGEKF